MTEKELKKLGRAELLELLLASSKENETLAARLAEANEKLENRKIIIDESGSIAEAAFKLSGIFEAAQSAADQYLENVRDMENRVKDICDRRDQECSAQCERRVKEAEAACWRMEEEARRKCSDIIESVKKEMQSHWGELGRKISLFNTEFDTAAPSDGNENKGTPDE